MPPPRGERRTGSYTRHVKQQRKRKPTVGAGIGAAVGRRVPQVPQPKPRQQPKSRAFTRDLTPPLARAQRQAQRKTDRAHRKAPQRPLPSVPVLRRPTPRQDAAAVRLMNRSVRKAAGRGATPAQTDRVLRDLGTDPRYIRKLLPIALAQNRQIDRLAVRAATRAGVRGSRARKVQAGRVLLAGVRQVQARPGVGNYGFLYDVASGISDLTNRPMNPALKHVVNTLETELSGQGQAVRLSGQVADLVGRGAGYSTGAGPALGTAAVRARTRPGGAAYLSPQRYELDDVPVLKRALQDMLNLPAQTLPSLYVPAAGLAEAAGGDERRLKQLGKDLEEGDPVYALAEALVRTVSGDVDGAKASFKRLGEIASQHPGFTAVELSGVRGAIGRGAGRTVRGAGRVARAVGEDALAARLQEIGGVGGRASARVPGTDLEQRRFYSPDLIRKQRQRATDAVRKRRAEKLRADAERVRESDPDRAMALLKAANRWDPEVMSARQVKRRIDITEGANEQVRRTSVGEADDRVSAVLKGQRGAGLSVIAQNITSAKLSDLRKYRDELKAVYDRLEDPGKRAANARLRKQLADTIRHAEKKGRKQLDGDRLVRVQEAARRYHDEIDAPLQERLAELGLIEESRADRAVLIPYAVREMGAKKAPAHWVDGQGKRVSEREVRALRREHGDDMVRSLVTRVPERLVDANGRFLSNDAIRAHMAGLSENGAATPRRDVPPSYVSQAPGAGSPGDYYRHWSNEPSIGNKSRSGTATLEGTFDGSPEGLRARAMKGENLIAAAEGWRNANRQVALRSRRTGDVKLFDAIDDAKSAQRALEAQYGLEFDVVRYRPWSVGREQFEAMLEALDSEAVDPRTVQQIKEDFLDALKGADGEGPFVLWPRPAVRQMRQHIRVLNPTDLGKFLRAGRSMFSQTVLSLSPSPSIGNLVEGVYRSAVMRAGPLSASTMRRILKRMDEIDPEGAKLFRATVFQGGKMTLASRKRYVDPGQFDDGVMRKLVAVFQAGKRAKGPAQVAKTWQVWTHIVFDQLNGRLETYFPMLQAGKWVRDHGLMDDGLMNLSNKAVDQAARKLLGTPEMAALTEGLWDSYGKYSSFSPGARWMVGEYTPFLAWWLSSVNFVFRVMPRDHPLMTALSASMVNATEEWRRMYGYDFFADGKLPNWMMGSGPAQILGGRAQLTRNTPMGAFTDPLGSTASLFFPQFRPILNAFQGKDWKGKELRHEDGTPYDQLELVAYAINQLLSSSVPLVAVPERAAKTLEDPGWLLNAVRLKTNGQSYGTGPVQGTPRALSPDQRIQREEIRRAIREQMGTSQVQREEIRRAIREQLRAAP